VPLMFASGLSDGEGNVNEEAYGGGGGDSASFTVSLARRTLAGGRGRDVGEVFDNIRLAVNLVSRRQ
jgi:hypothetical protein